MRFLEAIPISHNNASLVIGQIEHLLVEDKLVSEEGYVDLVFASYIGVSGLSNYFSLRNEASLPYTRPQNLTEFCF